METYAGPYPAVLAGGGRSILCGKRDACLAGIWLVAAWWVALTFSLWT